MMMIVLNASSCFVLQLPKIEAQILELVTKYEAETGNTFTVDGKPLLRLIEEEWATRKTVSITEHLGILTHIIF